MWFFNSAKYADNIPFERITQNNTETSALKARCNFCLRHFTGWLNPRTYLTTYIIQYIFCIIYSFLPTYDRMWFYLLKVVDSLVLFKPQILQNEKKYVIYIFCSRKKKITSISVYVSLYVINDVNHRIVNNINNWGNVEPYTCGFHKDWNFLSKRVKILVDFQSNFESKRCQKISAVQANVDVVLIIIQFF